MRHHSRPAALIPLLACLLLAPAALADDIVHFQNGTFMKVQGYALEGDTVKVTLGPGASMSFPKSLVESIERSGRTVYPQGSSGPANVVVSGGAGGNVSSSQFLQRGEYQVPARYKAGAGEPTAPAEGTAAEKDAAAARPDRTAFQVSGNRAEIHALGRRSGPLGEALIEKDPNAPPTQVQRPRGFATLAPRGSSTTTPVSPAPEATPPAELPPPADPEPPQEDPPAEDDGGN